MFCKLNGDVKIGNNQYTKEVVDNVNSHNSTDDGNSKTYIQRRLKREIGKGDDKAKEVFEKIKSKVISYNQAQKEMGWKTQIIQVQKKPEKFVEAISLTKDSYSVKTFIGYLKEKRNDR